MGIDHAQGKITFIGTATVLIEWAGFALLTDPNFLHEGDHAYLGLGLRSRRLTNPALEIGELPPLDAVVLSHHHGDHFDEVAARELRKDIPIITEPHSAGVLRRQGFEAPVSLQNWESHTLHNGDDGDDGDAWIRVVSLPGKHAPRPLGWVLPPVMGSMLELGAGNAVLHRIYLSGDTLFFDGLRTIADKFPSIDVGLIHLGGTRLAGVLLTMDGDQGVQALRVVRPRVAVPIHYDDYTVFRSPLSDFQSAVARTELDTEVHYLARGECYKFEVARSVPGLPGGTSPT